MSRRSSVVGIYWEMRRFVQRSGFSPGGVEESLMSMTNTVLVPDVVDRGFDPFRARVAVGGFLAGYTGQTFNAYALDLRQWVRWCAEHDLDLFEVRRAHMELFARWLEEGGRAKATVARRLSTITGFYRYCTEEALIATGSSRTQTKGVV